MIEEGGGERGGEVDGAVGVEGGGTAIVGAVAWARAFEGFAEEAIEGGGDKEIEIADGGEVDEALWDGEVVVFLDDFADFLVDLDAFAAVDEVSACGAVERHVRCGGDVETFGELVGDPVGELGGLAVLLDGDEAGADDGEDLAVVDIADEAVPWDGFECGFGGGHRW